MIGRAIRTRVRPRRIASNDPADITCRGSLADVRRLLVETACLFACGRVSSKPRERWTTRRRAAGEPMLLCFNAVGNCPYGQVLPTKIFRNLYCEKYWRAGLTPHSNVLQLYRLR
jgi:hypothetical protein